MRKIIVLLIALFFAGSAKAQLETSADFRRQVYDREYTFGVVGHSRGYAISGRYLKFIDGYNKQGLEIDISKLRHPKEVKVQPVATGGRGFVWNRINSLYTLRGGYVREQILYDKTDKGTVSISWIYSGGLSLGLLKPVYLNVRRRVESTTLVEEVAVRYNPEELETSTLIGEANFFKGIGETKIRPGLYAKMGINFDYQLIEEKVTALEVGVIFDHFFTEVPIFYEPNDEDVNWAGFFQMYVQFNFGFRKN